MSNSSYYLVCYLCGYASQLGKQLYRRTSYLRALADRGSAFGAGWWSLVVSVLTTFLMSNAFAGAIHDAARSGDLETIQHLVIDGADVNEVDNHDDTPLIAAALAGNGDIVNYLLQRGATIGRRNVDGMTPLHAAAYAGHVDIVNLLLAKGASVNDNDNRFGVYPLHLAAEENHLGVVKLLLKNGADHTGLELNGYTALTRAGWRENWAIVDELIAKGASCQEEEKVGEWLYSECVNRVSQ